MSISIWSKKTKENLTFGAILDKVVSRNTSSENVVTNDSFLSKYIEEKKRKKRKFIKIIRKKRIKMKTNVKLNLKKNSYKPSVRNTEENY